MSLSRMVWCVPLLWLASTACGPPVPARSPSPAPPPSPPDSEQLYASYAPAIAQIRAIYRRTVDAEDGGSKTLSTTNRGSAVHLGQGRFLTACHVLRHGDHDEIDSTSVILILARLTERGTVQELTELPAEVIRCDRERDLAIVHATRGKLPETSVAPARADPRPGQTALAIGAATRGFAWSAHPCQVAGLGKLKPDSGNPEVYPEDDPGFTRLVLQVACASYPMSGSPLLDGSGALVGVMQFWTRAPDDSESAKWRFFAPASEIRAFLADARSHDGGTAAQTGRAWH